VLIHVGAACVTAGSAVRRAVGVLLALGGMTPVWLIPREHTTFRALAVLVAFAGLMRNVDLTRGRWTLGARLVHASSIVDTRKVVRGAPSFDRTSWRRATLGLLLGYLTYLTLLYESPPLDARGWLARWLLGLVLIYAVSDGAYAWLEAMYRAIGLVTPPLHRSPIASRSVQEFWGERWNRIVGAWLAETLFRPLARRRRPVLGSWLAFTFSALLHAYVTWAALGPAMAFVMLGFFLVQAVILLLERLLNVRTWPRWAGQVWTIGWLACLSPMFTEPMARVLGC
jgi:hypothetical protein